MEDFQNITSGYFKLKSEDNGKRIGTVLACKNYVPDLRKPLNCLEKNKKLKDLEDFYNDLKNKTESGTRTRGFI